MIPESQLHHAKANCQDEHCSISYQELRNRTIVEKHDKLKETKERRLCVILGTRTVQYKAEQVLRGINMGSLKEIHIQKSICQGVREKYPA